MGLKDFYSIQCTVDDISFQTDLIKKWLNSDRQLRVITFLNPHVYNHALKDQIVHNVLNTADINSMDGIGIKLGFLLEGFRYYQRTIMTYLFEKVLYTDQIPKTNAILIGTSEEEVARTARRINSTSPCINIKSYHHGFHELEFYISEIAKSTDIDIILIGMSTPKSEHLIYKLQQTKEKHILWHIGGGTIKCFADTKRRSPVWLSQVGFEWIHRALFEPHLIGRYIFGIPKFIINILRMRRKLKRK